MSIWKETQQIPPSIDSTRNDLVRDVVGRKDDTVAGNSLMALTKQIVAAVGPVAVSQLRTEQSYSGPVEEGALINYAISIWHVDTGAVPSGDINIASISAVMQKSTGGAAFNVSGITQPTFLKSAGLVYCDYQFVASEWKNGDIYKLTVTGITAVVSGSTVYVDAMLWSNVVTEYANVEAKIDAIQTDIGNPSVRSNLKTLEAMLGNPDFAGKSIYLNLGDFAGQTSLPSLLSVLGVPDVAGKSLYVCVVTDRLDDGTIGLAAIKAAVVDVNTDLGNPSVRSNLVSIEAMLGNPDAVGKTLYANTGDFVGQTNLKSVLAALGIPDTAGKPLYTVIVTDRLDDATIGLSAIKVAITDANTDIGNPSARSNLQSLEAMLGNPDTAGKNIYDNIGDFVGRTNLKSILASLGIPDVSGKSLYTCIVTDRLDDGTIGLTAIKGIGNTIKAEVESTSVATAGGSNATLTRAGLLLRWLVDNIAVAPGLVRTEIETTSLATAGGSNATLTRAGLLLRWLVDNVSLNSTVSKEATLLKDMYKGAIWIDMTNGAAGTVLGVNGLPTNPVNSITSAHTLATALGVRKYMVISTNGVPLSLEASYSNWVFEGVGHLADNMIGLNSNDGAFITFKNIVVLGASAGSNYLDISGGGLACSNFGGAARGVLLSSPVNTNRAVPSLFIDCTDFNGTSGTELDYILSDSGRIILMKNFKGHLIVKNMEAGDSLEFDSNDGEIIVAASCTGGTITRRGVHRFTDLSGGAVSFVVTGLVNGADFSAIPDMAKETSVGAIQTDLGNPSARTYLKTLELMLGNPDAAGKSLYDNLGDFKGQTNLQSLLAALGIPDVAVKSLYTCLITDRLDSGTIGLNALKVLIDAINVDLGNYSAQTNLQSLLAALGIPDVAAKSLYTCLITDRLDSATIGLSAIKTVVSSDDSSGSFSYLDAGGEQVVVKITTTTRKTIQGIWLDLVNMTQNGTIKLYYKIDGATYREFDSFAFTVLTDSDGIYINLNMGITNDFEVRYTEGAEEGAARAIPYSIIYDTKE